MISFYAPLGSAECPVNNDCVSPFCSHIKKSGAFAFRLTLSEASYSCDMIWKNSKELHLAVYRADTINTPRERFPLSE